MAAAPTVSVVIPTYNRAPLIRQAIDSVLSQTYSDFEVIVVDDESTDGTEAVVRTYGERVRYLRIRHGGIAHARNAGMEAARGRYFTFLDSDDLLHPWALELETRLLDRFPDVAMACAEMTGFDDKGWEERYHLRNYHLSSFRDPSVTFDAVYGSSLELADACRIPEALLRDDSGAGRRRVYRGNVFDAYLLRLVLCQNTAMLRREVVAEIGPRLEHVYNYEEYDWLLRLARRHAILFVDVPTYRLRYHDWQISSTARPDGLLVWIRKQLSLLRVFRRHALADRNYYGRNRQRLDRRLAELYRGAAVPMLLAGGNRLAGRRGRRYLHYARACLSRCRRLGYPQPALALASLAPHPVRNAFVRSYEGVRKDGLAAALHRALAGVFRKIRGRR